MSSGTSKKAKSATQQYKNAVQNNSKAVHDALATATAKGVEDAHVKVTSGSAAYPSAPGKYGKPVGTTGLPKRLPDKALALLFEVLGAVSGTFAGTAFALKELFGAAYLQLRKATGLRQAA